MSATILVSLVAKPFHKYELEAFESKQFGNQPNRPIYRLYSNGLREASPLNRVVVGAIVALEDTRTAERERPAGIRDYCISLWGPNFAIYLHAGQPSCGFKEYTSHFDIVSKCWAVEDSAATAGR